MILFPLSSTKQKIMVEFILRGLYFLYNHIHYRENAKNPCFWSRVCLNNMAKLAKEATTMRRILESLFRYFDDNKLWSGADGLALPVLKDLQFLVDDSGTKVTFFIYYLLLLESQTFLITNNHLYLLQFFDRS